MEQLIMTQFSEIISPDFHVSFNELCESANISAEYMIELVEYNIIYPVRGKEPQEWQFNIVNKAARLYRDLEIDWADIGLVLNLLDEIEQLKNENGQLKQQLNRFLTSNH
jgi:chaperone modulatory protein CbpM